MPVRNPGAEDAGVTKQGCNVEATSGQTLGDPPGGRRGPGQSSTAGLAVVVPRTGWFHRRVIDWMKEEQAVLERQVPAEPAELWTVAGFPEE